MGDVVDRSTYDVVELTRELIRFETINPPGSERRCAEFVAELLHGFGFEVSLRELAADRASVIATSPGTSHAAPLVFTGHFDVVPLGTRAWTHDPFGADVIDGRIYGRGSSDMKSGVAAFLCAALKVVGESGIPNLKLVVTAGEETGCDGASALAAEGNLGRAAAIVVAEPTANAVCVGHKGALWLNAIATGVAAHGSMPERGDNAIYKAARVINGLQSFSFEGAVHPTLGAPTLSVNTVRGGVNINSVPDRAEIGIDIRTIPTVNHAGLIKRLEQSLGADARIDVSLDVQGVWTSPDIQWVKRVARIAAEATGNAQTTGAATFFSDASVLTPAMGNPPTIILGPGEPGQAHQTDEWCSVERIHHAVAIYTRLIRDWMETEA
jgi:succinyl-diaminopimelate desuccinylase